MKSEETRLLELKNEKKKESHFSLFVFFLSSLIILLSLIVMLGWHIQNQWLVQIFPNYVPMQYNTAVGFLLTGLSLLFLFFKRYYFVFINGFILFFLGFLTISQYLFGIDFNIDQLFMEPFTSEKTAYPGRMSFITALSFILTSLPILLLTKKSWHPKTTYLSGVIGASVIVIGIANLVGYFTGSPTPYGLEQLSYMAIHTSFGFLLTGVGIFIISYAITDTPLTKSLRWFSFPVGFIILGLSISVWYALNSLEQIQLKKLVENEVDNIAIEVQELIEPRIEALVRMAKRWEVNKGTPKKIWESDAKNYVFHQPDYQVIAWVNPSYKVEWMIPEKGNEPYQNLDLRFEKNRREALEKALREKRVALTKTIKLVQGDKGFSAYAPLFIDNKFSGFMSGVFRYDKLFEQIGDKANMYGYNVSISDGEETILKTYEPINNIRSQWGQKRKVSTYNLNWEIQVWPNPELITSSKNILPELIFLIGFLSSILFTLILRYSQILSSQTKHLKDINIKLAQEIEQRKEMEESIKEREEKFKNLFHHSNDAILLFSSEGTILDANEKALAQFGYTRSELLMNNISFLHTPEEQETVCQEFGKLLRNGFMSSEFEFVKKDRNCFPGWISAKRMEINGAIIHQGIIRDISIQKEAEKELKKEKEFSEKIIMSSEDGIVAIDKSYQITLWNDGMQKITGLTKDDVLNKNVLELFSFLTQLDEDKKIKNVIDKGEVIKSKDVAFDIPQTNKHGFYDGIYFPIRESNGEIIGGVGIIREITQAKELEEQLRQTQKMESLGHLAGGIAHDFNNLLTAILGYSQILLETSLDEKTIKSHIKEIHTAGQRGSELTKQLLAFSRKQKIEPKIINLNSLSLGMEKMLNQLLFENIELEFQLQNSDSFTKADPNQMEQVLLNLVVNARDAMPEGGKITISTKSITFSENSPKKPTNLNPGAYLELSIKDTGEGIPEEIKKNIFEPFFTTKEEGKGTGMGLATVYGIITQNNGDIVIESSKGKGTTFYIYLPLIIKEDDFEEESSNKCFLTTEMAKNTRKVLIVEDEESVRTSTAESLRQKGFEVLEATNAHEATQIIKKEKNNIGLLICDIGLPGKSGIDLACQTVKEYPLYKILFISGHMNKTIHEEKYPIPHYSFLEKPFVTNSLIKSIYHLITSEEAA